MKYKTYFHKIKGTSVLRGIFLRIGGISSSTAGGHPWFQHALNLLQYKELRKYWRTTSPPVFVLYFNVERRRGEKDE